MARPPDECRTAKHSRGGAYRYTTVGPLSREDRSDHAGGPAAFLGTPVDFFLQDMTPNDASFVRWHYAVLPTRVDLRTFRTQVIGAVDRPLRLSFDDFTNEV
jgi:DMSO/TMAO reductase YedYZ molybdopterin-dependent catalytic subunit